MSELRGFNAQRMQQLASRINNVVATITDFQPISDRVARVAVVLSSAHVSSADAAIAIARATNNQASAVPGSFRKVEAALAPTLIGFVASNREALSADDERVKRFEAQTASILMDPTDESLWRITEEGGATLFVRTDTQDLHTALASVRGRDVRAPRLEVNASLSSVGEYMSYVTQDGELRHGFVCASADGEVNVLPEGSDDLDTISEDQVIEAYTLDDHVEQAAAVGLIAKDFDSSSPEAMKEYYARMYSYAPNYIAKINKQIDGTAAV